MREFYAQVDDHIQQYENGTIIISEDIPFSMHQTVRQISHYILSKYMGGQKDPRTGARKPSRNIGNAIVDLEWRAKNIDRKSIEAHATVTLEDESANANLIVWPTVFEKNRRAILAATMMGCRGRVQSANGVIHLIVEKVADLSADLKLISGLDTTFPLAAGRGDEAKHGGNGLDSREPKALAVAPRDMYEPDLNIDTLKLKARNFR